MLNNNSKNTQTYEEKSCQTVDQSTNSNSKTSIILTNNEIAQSSSSSSSPSNVNLAPCPSPPLLYENDFDLYIMLKDMITKSKKPHARKKSTPTFKDYTKSLTARLLDSHFTNGKNEWCLIENGMDLYRSKVKCIGTNINDFDYGDPVFLDFQPLSTRIKLMCKLIIIIQGACLERTGPPKLVQDRCIQFDGICFDDSSSINSSLPKVKSNSCENILEDLNLPYLQVNSENSENDFETKISIFSTFNTKNKIPHRLSIRRSRKHSSHSNAMSDDESSLSSYYNISSNNKNNDDERILQNSCDMEHYFKYRISKNSNKDYASLPYYQYSTYKEMKFVEKSTNTSVSYISELRNVNTNEIKIYPFSPRKLNQATSTDDLLSNFNVGYYSKYQLLSSQSLFEKKSSLMNSSSSVSQSDPLDTESNILNTFSTLPIYISIRNGKPSARTQIPIDKCDTSTNNGDKKKAPIVINDPCSDSSEENKNNSTKLIEEKTDFTFKTHEYVELDDNTNEKNENETILTTTKKSNFNLSNDHDQDKYARLKIGPKKSSEWTIFKYTKLEDFKKKIPKSNSFDSNGSLSTVTTITTTTTTTTKTTKVTEKSVETKQPTN